MSGTFTWISDPQIWLAALFGAALLLGVSLAQAAAFRSEVDPFAAETSLPVLEESVVVSAPRGYCIDRLATLSGQTAAFVLLGSCRAITGDSRAARPETPGLLTAAVDGSGTQFPSEAELSRFFASDTGRAALSRSGDPLAMTLGASYNRQGVFYLHASESDDTTKQRAQSWRAVFELNGRMVTTTLRDLPGQPIDRDEGFRTVEQFVRRIRSASPLEQGRLFDE
ncbi:hypothetical protein R3X27_01430 [Tropicimonas sp. TH_r6]|uniref:hypothetical protein n=1 Tax=Tropicimonas sp. TH_r6 TaxID=3082085 RepID=UPI00295571CC|nr:hypothetical protein [Tropicimonas sp. TH_r6]MDV7141335.1 hypothetical protein [Tropicimonas sp. TH_r6]